MSSLVPVQAASPSAAIVEEVATRESVGATELPPLYESVDSEAIDALVDATEPRSAVDRIRFTYHGYEVTVTGDGVVHLEEVG